VLVVTRGVPRSHHCLPLGTVVPRLEAGTAREGMEKVRQGVIGAWERLGSTTVSPTA
jgi:hypothetical protein